MDSSPDTVRGERLVGFDLRNASPSFVAHWRATFPACHIYRRDVLCACSVDTLVWPTLLPDPWGNPLEGRPIPAPSGLQNLAASLDDVRAWAAAHADMGQTTVIAVGIDLSDWTDAQHLAWKERTYNPKEGYVDFWEELLVEPKHARQDWRLLGYDVADAWLIGGLSNCGLAETTLEPYRSRVAAALNGFHLFDHREDALEFAVYASGEVPEHAPFFVYPLWCVAGALPSHCGGGKADRPTG